MQKTWEEILKRPAIDNSSLENSVLSILNDVKENRDAALKKYTMIFDRKKVVSNIYNENGMVIKAEVYDIENEVKSFLELRDRLLKLPLEKVR